MSAKFGATPWMRNALVSAGVDQFIVAGRIPDGWSMRGSALSSRGPYHFAVRGPDGKPQTFAAQRIADIRVVLERALASMGSDDLESVLAASLAARGETA